MPSSRGNTHYAAVLLYCIICITRLHRFTDSGLSTILFCIVYFRLTLWQSETGWQKALTFRTSGKVALNISNQIKMSAAIVKNGILLNVLIPLVRVGTRTLTLVVDYKCSNIPALGGWLLVSLLKLLYTGVGKIYHIPMFLFVSSQEIHVLPYRAVPYAIFSQRLMNY